MWQMFPKPKRQQHYSAACPPGGDSQVENTKARFNAQKTPGFRVFVKKLQPSYRLPSEPTVTKLLGVKHSKLKEAFAAKLSEATCIILTMDIWSQKGTMRSFLGVTIHFPLDNVMVSGEIEAYRLTERKTIPYLRSVIQKICREWSIDNGRVRAAISDGGANIKGALKEEFPGRHISCLFAHLLDNIGQRVLRPAATYSVPSERENPPADAPLPDRESDVEDDDEEEEIDNSMLGQVVKHVKATVKFFRQSEVATSELVKLQVEEKGIPESQALKLIQEVKTRWNSRVEALGEVRDLLKPLAIATKEISQEHNPTLSKCIPLVSALKSNVGKVVAGTPIGFNLKAALLSRIQTSLGKIEEIKVYSYATILDPRFKKVCFSSAVHPSNAAAAVAEKVKRRIEQTLEKTNDVEPAPEPDEQDPNDFWGNIDSAVKQAATSRDAGTAAVGYAEEFRAYLNSPPLDRKSNPNPLKAWESIKHLYPNVLAGISSDIQPTTYPRSLIGQFAHESFVLGAHLHGLLWIDNSPDVTDIDTEEKRQNIVQFYDKLISTFHPNINERKPIVHPCQVKMSEVQDPTKDLAQLLNRVQRHSIHKESYCLRRNKRTKKIECRFQFPKNLEVSSTYRINPETNEMEFIPKRNDPILNNFNGYIIQTWRASIDISAVMSKQALINYLAKYISKPERESRELISLLKGILNEAEDDQEIKKSIQRLYIQCCSERDYSAQEPQDDYEIEENVDDLLNDIEEWMTVSSMGPNQKAEQVELGKRDSDVQCNWQESRQRYEKYGGIPIMSSFIASEKQKSKDTDERLPPYPAVNFNVQHSNILNLVDKQILSLKNDNATSTFALPKRVIVQGSAGTGKSLVINAIKHKVHKSLGAHSYLLMTPTGVSAKNINDSTYHSTLHINMKSKEFSNLTGPAAHILQNKLKDIKFIIIDEFSMVGCEAMHMIEERIKQAKDNDNDFASCFIYILGDVKQLPPIGDKAI
ncbi:ATP-dependent DNA helicase [Frankliniella fusca]|uniref:ATP-dependent DNA helicase n=1 Tax=Frankliniella fusca TaxID=407009 RepID=A0AAE1HB35_9NEOP|nr:ATP-dependent DNA helicase [Frankliniella fusca]